MQARYRRLLEGKILPPPGTVGDYDLEVLLAMELHWDRETVHSQDPDYLEQIVARLKAGAEHREAQAKKQQAKQERGSRRK